MIVKVPIKPQHDVCDSPLFREARVSTQADTINAVRDVPGSKAEKLRLDYRQRSRCVAPKSAAQRSAVWNDLSKEATNQNASGFDATIGTFVPSKTNLTRGTTQKACDCAAGKS
jgi:hypothetical protein